MISVLKFGSHAEGQKRHTDASAIRAWLEKSDEAAAAWLFEKYLPLVMHVCSRKLPRTWTPDAIQKTMSHAFQSLREFDSERSFSSWIASIASHVCVEYSRRLRLNLELPISEVAPGAAEIAVRERSI